MIFEMSAFFTNCWFNLHIHDSNAKYYYSLQQIFYGPYTQDDKGESRTLMVFLMMSYDENKSLIDNSSFN